MPEEINRRLVDHMSQMLITTSKTATKNLVTEGINQNWIYETGDTMVDAILKYSKKAEKESKIFQPIIC